MPAEQVPAPKTGRRCVWVRLLVLALFAAAIVHGLSVWMRADSLRPEPAGFGRGFLHGATMPLAWPGLVLGRDALIYAERNTGRTYRLGYTTGVNLCGALFFGAMYRRVGRLCAMGHQ